MNRASRQYNSGDEITLTVRVIEDVWKHEEIKPSSLWCCQVLGSKGNGVLLASADLDAGTLTPRPIQVGDRVTWGTSRLVDYEVLLLRGGDACLANDRSLYGVPHGGMIVAPVSSLTKVLS